MMRNDEDSNGILIDLSLQQNIYLTERLLSDMIESQGTECESIFNSQNIPLISLSDYLQRLHKFTKYSSPCLIIAIVLIDRYHLAKSSFSLNWHNVHRLLLACLLLAVKFQDDVYFDNYSFQMGGGVSRSQLLGFELEIFSSLDYSVFVQEHQYEEILAKLTAVYGNEE